MYLLQYKMKDDTVDIEEEYSTLLEAFHEMKELMDDMVEYAYITDDNGDLLGSR